MSTLANLLRARTGRMTSELRLVPGTAGLGHLPARLQPTQTTTSVCGYCSTGCGLKIHLNAEGEAINLSPDPDYPVNLGAACPKGWEALSALPAKDRATSPLLRDSHGTLAPVSWEQAVQTFAVRFKMIQRHHGPHSIAFLSTGQIVTEEMALLGALFKFGMGGLHCDSNTRQCMATAHVAYKQSFGFDAPPYTYADFEASDALIFVGANPCIAHPIMWQRVQRNPHQPEIVVIDPRRTETAQAATLHVPLRPKSDLILLYGLAHLLIERGAVKHEFVQRHTTGYEAFAAFVREFTLDRVALETGLPEATLQRLADIIATRERVSFWWTMGVNQSHEATRTAQALINLALMTGNIGRPGTGANSITGQCNAMGSRLFGNATSLLGGYDFTDASDRAHVATVLGIEPERIPAEPGYAYDEILDAIERGEIRGLWIIATNTAHSWIDHGRAQRLLAQLDFLVVQDMYANTESAILADLVLPAAGWGEKDGVLINSERRLGRVRKVRRAPGQALSDFSIFQAIAAAWGCSEMFVEWRSPAATFQILKELSRGQPCDFSGVRDYDHLDTAGGIQWPYPDREPATETREDDAAQAPSANERRLFADGQFFTVDGRARFIFDPPRPMPEPPDTDYPFILLTGRGTSAQWHTGSRTNKSAVLGKLAASTLVVEINPADAHRLKITAGMRIAIRSRRGKIEATAFVTSTVQVGQVFVPMHGANVNVLTHPSFDPHSRQPSYKAAAVDITPAS